MQTNKIDAILLKMQKFIELLCGILVGILTVVIFGSVMSRAFLDMPITITTEITSLVFPWITALAAILITVNEEHIALVFIKGKFSGNARKSIDIMILFLSIGFCAIMTKSSFDLCVKLKDQILPLTRISKVVMYGSVLVAFALMLFILVYQLLKTIRKVYR